MKQDIHTIDKKSSGHVMKQDVSNEEGGYHHHYQDNKNMTKSDSSIGSEGHETNQEQQEVVMTPMEAKMQLAIKHLKTVWRQQAWHGSGHINDTLCSVLDDEYDHDALRRTTFRQPAYSAKCSPLMRAVMLFGTKTKSTTTTRHIELLLDAGADPYMAYDYTLWQCTPFEMAAIHGHESLLRLFEASLHSSSSNHLDDEQHQLIVSRAASGAILNRNSGVLKYLHTQVDSTAINAAPMHECVMFMLQKPSARVTWVLKALVSGGFDATTHSYGTMGYLDRAIRRNCSVECLDLLLAVGASGDRSRLLASLYKGINVQDCGTREHQNKIRLLRHRRHRGQRGVLLSTLGILNRLNDIHRTPTMDDSCECTRCLVDETYREARMRRRIQDRVKQERQVRMRMQQVADRICFLAPQPKFKRAVKQLMAEWHAWTEMQMNLRRRDQHRLKQWCDIVCATGNNRPLKREVKAMLSLWKELMPPTKFHGRKSIVQMLLKTWSWTELTSYLPTDELTRYGHLYDVNHDRLKWYWRMHL